ncbi:MAG: UvrD-helicase domain-containing protein, partial [Peptococcaceae bacterium]|nr:UvrD-helicase domain-containing protein [Peptococcaceae bacterium]
MTGWNDGQRRGIDASGENTLVSASAGTGKTTVLVERLIRRLVDPVSPLDMDRFLFVTFTNAAAQSMIRKVRRGIEERAGLEPHNRLLARQRQLLGQAAISTLHGFCLDLIRRHYRKLGIDPDGRVLGETEQILLQREVLDAFLEDCYKENEPGFAALTTIYGGERSDESFKELILRVYRFAAAQPYPYAWLDGSVSVYREPVAQASINDIEKLISQSWEFAVEKLHSIAGELETGAAMARSLPALEKYETCLAEDMGKIRALSQIADWDAFVSAVTESGKLFDRLPTILAKQNKDEAPEAFAIRQIIQPRVKAIREKCKKSFQSLVSSLAGETKRQIREETALMSPAMLALASVAEGFYRRYEEAKREEAVFDFDDIEHYTLELLIDGEGGPTPLAVALRERYQEILVDEYQDINPVQEAILQALHGKSFYMVGDVKQSIYGFRQAAPRLFMEKYHRYRGGNGGELVALEESYRGSQWIVEGINQVFDYGMTEASGGIDYRREGRFICAAPLPEEGCPSEDRLLGKGALELYVIDLDEAELSAAAEVAEKAVLRGAGAGAGAGTGAGAGAGADAGGEMYTDTEADTPPHDDEQPEPGSLEAEAAFCARRIEELSDEWLWDRDKNERRQVQYKDIVILLQSMKGVADVFVQALRDRDIPVYADIGGGYFQAQEVQTAISFLKILDNPRQDIPLATLMLSPAIGFTAEELGKIKAAYKDAWQTKQSAETTEAGSGRSGKWGGLYKALTYAAVREKKLGIDGLRGFLRVVKEFRRQARQSTIADVLARFYEETGFLTMSAAMPGGIQRRANLLALIQRAREFEETNLQGMYQFIKFLEAIESRGEDLAAAPIIGEGENVVRIMSIHKSKGLEFPIVVLATAGRRFNSRDAQADLLLHETYGMASKIIRSDYRVKYAGVYHRLVASKIMRESIEEKLRTLYVALTRAEQRLIVIASYKDGSRRFQGWLDEKYQTGETIKENLQASSFMDWLGPAILGFQDHSFWVSRLLSADEIFAALDTKKEDKKLWQTFLSAPGLPVEDQKWAFIGDQMEWRYPWGRASGTSAKLSVTQAKGRLYPEEDPEAADAPWKGRTQPVISGFDGPRFLQKDRILTPGERGTLVHKILSRIQPVDAKSYMEALIKSGKNSREAAEAYVDSLLNRLVAKEHLTLAEASWADKGLLVPFLLSDLFQRMA